MSKIILTIMVWLSLNNFHEETIAIGSYFNNLDKIGQEEFYKYNFYLGYAYYSVGNKESATKYLTLSNESFINGKMPRRFKISEYLLDEMKTWEPGLFDISRDMKRSEQRLEAAKAGKITQNLQENIIKKLDKEIKDIEDAENKAKGEGKYSKDSDKGAQSPKPSDESKITQDPLAKGEVDPRKLKKLAESWGTLPPAERAKAIQDITRDLSPKHRQMYEDYMKSLNRGK